MAFGKLSQQAALWRKQRQLSSHPPIPPSPCAACLPPPRQRMRTSTGDILLLNNPTLSKSFIIPKLIYSQDGCSARHRVLPSFYLRPSLCSWASNSTRSLSSSYPRQSQTLRTLSQMSTHKALLLLEKQGEYAVKDIPTPKPGPGELLVEIRALCFRPCQSRYFETVEQDVFSRASRTHQ